ncbi:hypothetical protein ACROYT_G016133 [Oculina patagonica]
MEDAPVWNPRGKAGFLSLLTFSWISHVLKLGSKQPLEEKHLFAVETPYKTERLVADLEREWLAEEKWSEQNRTKLCLWKAMMRVIPYRDYSAMAFLRFCYTIALNFFPLLIWFFLRNISTASEMSGNDDDYYYATALEVDWPCHPKGKRIHHKDSTILHTRRKAQAWQAQEYMATYSRDRIEGLKPKLEHHPTAGQRQTAVEDLCCCPTCQWAQWAILYLNRCTLHDTISENTINLVSNDAQAMELLSIAIFVLPFAPLDLVISMALLWYLFAWQALVGASIFLIVVVYGSFAAHKIGKVRHQSAAVADKRLETMKEIITGIRVVKMYAWEWNFRDLVAQIRRKEISLFFSSSAMAGFVSVTIILFTKHPLTALKLFTLISILSNIKFIVTMLIAEPLHFFADARTACNRMQHLVEKKAILTRKMDHKDNLSSLQVHFRGRRYKPQFIRIESFRNGRPALVSARKLEQTSQHIQPQVSLENVSCFWSQMSDRPALRNVSLSATDGQLVGITGPVGSGKTSLLRTIIGELPISSGTISCTGKIAYISQSPWVYSGTVRENIVFVFWIAPLWWLSRMSEMPFEQQKSFTTLAVYESIVTVSLLLTIISSFCFYLAALKASENLHDQMTKAVMKAPVLFFDTNPVGRILNRFSKDIGSMDALLPGQFLFASQLWLYFFSATILSAVTNVWLFITCTPLTVLFIYLAKYYLKSAREIRRLEAITCSSVYSLIADTVTGLEVIRSSEMEDDFLRQFYQYQDKNTTALILLKASTRWLALRADLLSNSLVTSVSAGALFATQSPALAGMFLTFAAETLEVTSYGIRVASETENDIRAPATLNNISVCVADKEKVGVAGRTGAGKSYLVAALFRMPEPEGELIIDGVNIKDLNLQSSRRSMAVITQDPVLFSGTLRKNLDPFSLNQDLDLWRALEDVQLKTLVQQLPDQLEYKLRESGNNFSVGERQLLCLARALLQRSKIIILDEATANVDFKTDRLIQEVIRHRFKDSTVVTGS